MTGYDAHARRGLHPPVRPAARDRGAARRRRPRRRAAERRRRRPSRSAGRAASIRALTKPAVWQGRLAARARSARAAPQRLAAGRPAAVARGAGAVARLRARARRGRRADRGRAAEALARGVRRARGAISRAGTVALAGEDVHSAVEAELTARCGDPARRLHTGRSRNDQVATLLRMRVMRAVRRGGRAACASWSARWSLQARAAGDQAVAAYTHLQPAQPVLLAHWWLAHVAAFERDEERFLAAREAADRHAARRRRGRRHAARLRPRRARRRGSASAALAENSLDAVGDRDFALEYLNAAALLGVHLSRLAEDLVLWCSPGVRLVHARPTGSRPDRACCRRSATPTCSSWRAARAARLLANAQRLAIAAQGPAVRVPEGSAGGQGGGVRHRRHARARCSRRCPPAIAALDAAPERMAPSAHARPARGRAGRRAGRRGRAVPRRARRGRRGCGPRPSGGRRARRRCRDDERLAISPHFTDERLARAQRRGRARAPQSRARRAARRRSRRSSRAPRRGSASAPAIRSAIAGVASRREARGATRARRRRRRREPRTAATASAADGIALRRAHARRRARRSPRIMADYVVEGMLLPRPVSELYQCVREFHVAESTTDGRGRRAAPRCACCGTTSARCARSRCGPTRTAGPRRARWSRRVLDDARALGAAARDRAHPRGGVLRALRLHASRRATRCRARCGPTACAARKRHACDEVAVVLDLVPGASEAAAAAPAASWTLPIPQPRVPGEPVAADRLVKEDALERMSAAAPPRRPARTSTATGCSTLFDAGRPRCAPRAARRDAPRPLAGTHRGARVPQAVAAHARVVHGRHARAGRRRGRPGRGRGDRERPREPEGRGARAVRACAT